MSSILHHTYMRAAIQEAHKAQARGEVPIGAVIVDKGGNILARASNRTLEYRDPTAHAEMLVIREACQKVGYERLGGHFLYTTLEPCPMCASAISLTRLQMICFGAWDPKGGGIVQGPKIFTHPTCNYRPFVLAGLLAKECSELLTNFFEQLRLSKKRLH